MVKMTRLTPNGHGIERLAAYRLVFLNIPAALWYDWNHFGPNCVCRGREGGCMANSKKSERSPFESERNFRLLVQGITDYAIYMLDPEGHVTNWNRGAERIKG